MSGLPDRTPLCSRLHAVRPPRLRRQRRAAGGCTLLPVAWRLRGTPLGR